MGAALAVRRARLTGPGAGEGRALLTPALAAVPLERLGLPPGALLLVPRLASPHPLRPGQARIGFVEGVTGALAQALAEAERDPVTGISERPRLFTSAAAHWAWRIGAMQDGLAAPAHHPPALHPATPAELRRRLLPEGRLLAPVLARLAATARAARFLSGLSAEDIAAAMAALGTAHGLSAFTPPSPHVPQAEPALPVADPELDQRLLAAIATDPAVTMLPPDARMLLLAACDVAQHPGRHRGAAWQARLVALAHAPAQPAAAYPRATSIAPVTRPASLQPAHPLLGAAEPAAAPPRSTRTPIAASRSLEPPTPPSNGVAEMASQPAMADTRSSFSCAAVGTHSPHAGLLFLLNALVALGLTPGPDQPQAPGVAPLQLLAALGRILFGPSFLSDPLASAAAEDSSSLPPVPPALVNPALASRALRRAASASRLIFVGPCRLILADMPLPRRKVPARVAGTLARHLGARLHPVPVQAIRLPRREPARSATTLARLLVHRLAAAGVTPADLRVAGTLHWSDEALDVRFALADLPFAVRAAGLDRDPGFLPRAGRIVRFHFVTDHP